MPPRSVILVRLLLLTCCLLMACRSSETTLRQAPPTAAPMAAVTATPILSARGAVESSSGGSTPAAATAQPTAPTPPPPAPMPPAPMPPAPTSKPVAPAPQKPTASKPTAPPAPTAVPTPAACQYGRSRHLAEAQDRSIKEASALVASQRFPGVYWTLNDSGNSPSVFALDERGQSRGAFRVTDAENDDWESMQLGPGWNGGSALYIGDTGDNDRKRKEITIYRVPEPDINVASEKIKTERTSDAEAYSFTYPDGPRDAEALLVHPQSGEMLIVSKESLGRANVYRVPQPLDPGKRVTLERIAALDLAQFGVKADVVNDGAVSIDASRLVIRTYGSALEYDIPPGASLASVWGQTPRVARMQDGIQAEGVTYRLDNSALISIEEGTPARLFETPREC